MEETERDGERWGSGRGSRRERQLCRGGELPAAAAWDWTGTGEQDKFACLLNKSRECGIWAMSKSVSHPVDPPSMSCNQLES